MAKPSGAGPDVSAAFSAETTRSVLDEACRAAGLDSSGAVLMRLGENALYRLADAPIVVRIARTMSYWDDASKEVAIARWLAERGVPGATVAGPAQQPVEALGHPVTFWRYINGRVASRDEIGVLGSLLRQLHALPRPATFPLPELDIFGRVSERIEAASEPRADKTFLLARLDQLRAEVRQLPGHFIPQ